MKISKKIKNFLSGKPGKQSYGLGLNPSWRKRSNFAVRCGLAGLFHGPEYGFLQPGRIHKLTAGHALLQ